MGVPVPVALAPPAPASGQTSAANSDVLAVPAVRAPHQSDIAPVSVMHAQPARGTCVARVRARMRPSMQHVGCADAATPGGQLVAEVRHTAAADAVTGEDSSARPSAAGTCTLLCCVLVHACLHFRVWLACPGRRGRRRIGW